VSSSLLLLLRRRADQSGPRALCQRDDIVWGSTEDVECRRRRRCCCYDDAPARAVHDLVWGSTEDVECRRRAAELRASVTRPTRSTVTISSRLTDNRHQTTAETNYKAFITTLLLTGTLVVFWLPYMVFQLLSAHVNPEQSVDAAADLFFSAFIIQYISLFSKV